MNNLEIQVLRSRSATAVFALLLESNRLDCVKRYLKAVLCAWLLSLEDLLALARLLALHMHVKPKAYACARKTRSDWVFVFCQPVDSPHEAFPGSSPRPKSDGPSD